MHVQLWIGKDYLEQLNKNIHNSTISEDDIFDNIVEYTMMPVLEGQIQVSIKYDTYYHKYSFMSSTYTNKLIWL